MDWFRVYHGMPTDPKWMLVAARAGNGTAPGHVVAVWTMLLDHASSTKPRGSVESIDLEAIAAGLGWPHELVTAIYDALVARKHIIDGQVRTWAERNPAKFDATNAERQKKHRARVKKAAEAGTARPASSPESNDSNDRYGVTSNGVTGVTLTEEIEQSSSSDEALRQETESTLKQTTLRTVREQARAFENVGEIWTALAAEGMPANFGSRTFNRKHLANWLGQGLTELQLAEALKRARARREEQRNPHPVNLGYLACFVDEVLNGAPSKTTNGGGYERGDELSRQFAEG
jgi:hypothetical protein